jgi:hypothetical protein
MTPLPEIATEHPTPQSATDIRKRRGVFTFASDLLDTSLGVNDLLAVFAMVIPVRVEHRWVSNDMEVYFVSHCVPTVSDGHMTPRYEVRITKDSANRVESVSFIPTTSLIGATLEVSR